MADIDRAGGGAGASAVEGERALRERRERAMAEAALTLAEIGERVRWRAAWSGHGRGLTCLARFPFAEILLTASEEDPSADDDPEALLPIRSITAVEANIPAIEFSRQRVVEEMESTVQRGLFDLVRIRPCTFLLWLALTAVSLRRTTRCSRLVFRRPITSLSYPPLSIA